MTEIVKHTPQTAIQLLTKTGEEMSELDRLIAEEIAGEAGQGYTFIPTRLKIGSGGLTAFVTDDGDTYKEVKAVIVVSQMARAYWPHTEDSASVPPLCTSPDARFGYFNAGAPDGQIADATHTKTTHPAVRALTETGEIIEKISCADCPLSVFGSADKGAGQACKMMVRLVLLVDGWATPAMLTLPPTSIKAFNAYASAQQSKRSAYFAVRSVLTLSKKGTGQTSYSVVEMARAEDLTDDEKRAVLAIRGEAAEYVRNTSIEAGDYVNGTTPSQEDDVAPF